MILEYKKMLTIRNDNLNSIFFAFFKTKQKMRIWHKNHNNAIKMRQNDDLLHSWEVHLHHNYWPFIAAKWNKRLRVECEIYIRIELETLTKKKHFAIYIFFSSVSLSPSLYFSLCIHCFIGCYFYVAPIIFFFIHCYLSMFGFYYYLISFIVASIVGKS